MRELANNREITIKAADKDGALSTEGTILASLDVSSL